MPLLPESNRLKQCSLCRKIKPASEFAKRTCSKDGLQAYCRTCCSEKSKEGIERRKLNPIPRTIPKRKRCKDCEQTKPAEEFYRTPRSKDGLDSLCIPCAIERVRRNCRRRATNPPVLPPDGMKTCNRCGERKSLRAFNMSRNYSDHRNPICKACYRHITRPKAIKQTYGLSMEQYQAMHDQQQGKCAICGKPETHTRHGQVVMLSVDHNHSTEAIRELLCSRCNRTIGLVGEDPEVLKAMLRYLRKHSD